MQWYVFVNNSTRGKVLMVRSISDRVGVPKLAAAVSNAGGLGESTACQNAIQLWLTADNQVY